MKTFIIAFAAILCSTALYSQSITRKPNESKEQFAERLKPENATVAHTVVDTKWNIYPVVIAFYDQINKRPKENDPDQQDYHRIIATLFIDGGSGNYSRILIDTFDSEGGDPEIQSVFFANADKDASRELIIIASWEQRHYDFGGTLYQTTVYDDVINLGSGKLKLLKPISAKLDGGCDCSWRDGKVKKVKFKDAKAIRAELKRLGY